MAPQYPSFAMRHLGYFRQLQEIAGNYRALYGLNRWGMPVYVALVLAGTLPIAFLSWRLIEKPWLSLKRISWPRRGPALRYHLPSAALPRLALSTHQIALPLSAATSRRDVALHDCIDVRE